jgi:hypothetical protein
MPVSEPPQPPMARAKPARRIELVHLFLMNTSLAKKLLDKRIFKI